MVKPRGKNTKRQAVRKQQLWGEADAKREKPPPLSPSPAPSAVPRGALDLRVVFDLYVVSDAADEVPSGEHPMGDHPPEAASLSPGELSRVLLAIVTRDLLYFLVVSLSHWRSLF